MSRNDYAFANCVMTAATAKPELRAVKVCGVVDPYDAAVAAELFSRVSFNPASLYVGMILQPNSARSLDNARARKISQEAKRNGATPVAVFYDETVEEIEQICEQIDVQTVQLHGPGCKQSLIENGGRFESGINWINAKDVLEHGEIAEESHELLTRRDGSGGKCLWTLYDAIPHWRGGNGKPFDWNAFTPAETPWSLCGALNPTNVREAIECLQPQGLDAAGGVCGPDKMRKDPTKLRQFFEEAVATYAELQGAVRQA